MRDALSVGSLFTGVGGFDLGLERAGMRVVWQCEQNEFCRRVLAKHWPDVPCYGDVRAIVADAASRGTDAAQLGRPLRRAEQGGNDAGLLPVPVPYVDVICGGFPCQDISFAGKGAGLDGARSGLWFEYARIIREIRPRYVIVENVPALRSRGLHRVLSDLAACGFDAEWDCIPASALGAPHQRDRLWIVAYPNADSGRLALDPQRDGADVVGPLEGEQRHHVDGLRDDVAYTERAGLQGQPVSSGDGPQLAGPRDGRPHDVADAEGIGQGEPADEADAIAGSRDAWPIPGGGGQFATAKHQWAVEPDVGRVADGVPARVDRLRALGNALVPQIAEWIGRRIVAYEGARHG